MILVLFDYYWFDPFGLLNRIIDVYLSRKVYSIVNLLVIVFHEQINNVDWNSIFNKINLNELILVGLQEYPLLVLDHSEMKADHFDSLLDKLVWLTHIFAQQGSTQIHCRDLKSLSSRLVCALFLHDKFYKSIRFSLDFIMKKPKKLN